MLVHSLPMTRPELQTRPINTVSADPGRYSFSLISQQGLSDLHASLREFGQVMPLVAVEREGGAVVVDGARRLKILRELGETTVLLALCDEREVWDFLPRLRLIGGAPLNPVETGVYLVKRMADTGETLEDLAPALFPSLGLAPKTAAAEDPLWLASLEEVDRLRFGLGETPMSGVRALKNAPREDQIATLNATRDYRLGANKFTETVRWMLECAWREGIPLAKWLSANPLPSPKEGGEALRDAVWRLRHPKLASLSDSFDRDAGAVNFPGKVALSHPTGFEGGNLRLSIPFRSLAELADFCEKIAVAVKAGELNGLEKYLD